MKSKVLRMSLGLNRLFRASAQHPMLTIGEDRPELLVVEKANAVNGLLSVTVFAETLSTYCLVLTVCQLKKLIEHLTALRNLVLVSVLPLKTDVSQLENLLALQGVIIEKADFRTIRKNRDSESLKPAPVSST